MSMVPSCKAVTWQCKRPVHEYTKYAHNSGKRNSFSMTTRNGMAQWLQGAWLVPCCYLVAKRSVQDHHQHHEACIGVTKVWTCHCSGGTAKVDRSVVQQAI